MLECVLYFLLSAACLVLGLVIVKWVASWFEVSIPTQVVQIVGLICIILLVIWFLPCLGTFGHGWPR